MASQVEIVNAGLTLLGESNILSLDDNVKPARVAKSIWAMTRDALLAGYNWSFAKARVQLPADAAAPVFGFANSFQLPVDCLRLLFLGDIYVGADLVDYRTGPTEFYTIEGRKILTDFAAPLNLRYVTRVVDTGLYAANFSDALACKLADRLCESLTASAQKRTLAQGEFRRAINEAIRANAIELPPVRLADDDWILSRL